MNPGLHLPGSGRQVRVGPARVAQDSELSGGIGYWADRDHWAAWGEAKEIGAAGRTREPFRAEDCAEGPWIAVELVLEVVGDLLRVGAGMGNPFELPAGDSDADPRIDVDVAKPIGGPAAGGSHDKDIASFLVHEWNDPGQARFPAVGGKQEDEPADKSAKSDGVGYSRSELGEPPEESWRLHLIFPSGKMADDAEWPRPTLPAHAGSVPMILARLARGLIVAANVGR